MFKQVTSEKLPQQAEQDYAREILRQLSTDDVTT